MTDPAPDVGNLATETFHQLGYFPDTSTRLERIVLAQGIAWVERHGLIIPPHKVVWFGGEGPRRGGINRRPPFVVKLRVDQNPQDLLLTVIHEIAHASDLSAFPELTRELCEARAEAAEGVAARELRIEL
jgi:hypothetical protein